MKLLNKRKKIKPRNKIGDLVRTTDLKKAFAKGDSTTCSYILYKIIEILNDTNPSYHRNKLLERYNEALLRSTKLTSSENEIVMKKLKITQIICN